MKIKQERIVMRKLLLAAADDFLALSVGRLGCADIHSSFLLFCKKISDHFCHDRLISTWKSGANPAPVRILHKNY
jgi:hypothetical protein